MKKISYLLSSVAVAATMFLASCGGEPTDATVSFSLSAGSVDVNPGDSVNFTASISSEVDLTSVTVSESVDMGLGGTPVDVTLSGTTGEYVFSGVVPSTAVGGDVITITFDVTDSKDHVTSVDFTVNVVVPTTKTTSATKLLGAQLASAGSYYSTATEFVHTQSEATADAGAAKIDVSFYQAAATAGSAKLISPDKTTREAAALTKYATAGLTTYFAESTLNFADATDTDIFNITASANKSVTVASGKVYEFVNSDGKKGLISVEALNDAIDYKGDVTIKVRVQE